jgi:hypothetical protein
MLGFSAARRAACWLFILVNLAGGARAQTTWNDSATMALVNRAIVRRAQQLADTGLVDYRATAHGYVNFLAQVGVGFPTPPKLVKADELELEVYWHAPNQSKQRIIGRRDTLLLPTDIAYHRDHLGIVQNNFANLIRVGEGDEVRDVPHPLSTAAYPAYDFALTDSFSIGSGAQRIQVYEVKVRPKDDRLPRIIGAVYLDRANADVVRMNLSFTRAAFLDEALEELSIVLENRLVAGRFWLPSTQRVEIKRRGEWLDYPILGIIRGRWEVGDYHFNLGLAPSIFVGPEIIQVPRDQLRAYKWTGNILDSLPPDVRAVSDPDIQRVQAEARALVQQRAIERSRAPRLSARNVSDFARYDRVEGFAFGAGAAKALGNGFNANVRARYGVEDKVGKGAITLSWVRPSGSGLRLFGSRDFRDVGDVAERSTAINSLAAQEWASDYTDPFLVRAVGGGADYVTGGGMRARFTGSYEWQSPVSVHARAVSGSFIPTIDALNIRVRRLAIEIDRPPMLSFFGTEVTAHVEARGSKVVGDDIFGPHGALRLAAQANIERPIGRFRLATATTIAGVQVYTDNYVPNYDQEFVYLGGPVSAPGYAFHSIVTTGAITEHVEWRMPAPFIPFSLGRFGRVPAQGTFAMYGHGVLANNFRNIDFPPPGMPPANPPPPPPRVFKSTQGFYPSVGAAYFLPFDLVRIDVARGLARGGRWTFNIDISREFWPIL